MEKRYLECNCEASEHLVRFGWWTNEKDPNLQYLYIEVQTATWMGFWSRVWTAFKYIFGLGNIGWSETIMFEGEAKKLRNIIDEYLSELAKSK